MGGEVWKGLLESNVQQMTLHKDELPTGIDEFERRVAEAIRLLPMLPGIVEDLFRQVREMLGKFLTEVGYVIESHTPFISLILRAFDWLEDVKAPTSNLSGVADSSLGNENLSTDWEGDAWTKYNEKRDAQTLAMDAIASRAETVHIWLVEILQANIEYTTKVVQQLARLAREIAPILMKALNPATAASAVADLKDVIFTVLELRIEEYSDIAKRLGAAVEKAGTLVNEMSEQKPFPYGGWPQAVL